MLTQAKYRPQLLLSTHQGSTVPRLHALRLSFRAQHSPRCLESLRLKAQANPPEEAQQDVEYKDSWSDIQFINMCRTAYGNLAGWQSPRDWKEGAETYQGMIEVSRALMKVETASCCTHSLPHSTTGHLAFAI